MVPFLSGASAAKGPGPSHHGATVKLIDQHGEPSSPTGQFQTDEPSIRKLFKVENVEGTYVGDCDIYIIKTLNLTYIDWIGTSEWREGYGEKILIEIIKLAAKEKTGIKFEAVAGSYEFYEKVLPRLFDLPSGYKLHRLNDTDPMVHISVERVRQAASRLGFEAQDLEAAVEERGFFANRNIFFTNNLPDIMRNTQSHGSLSRLSQ